MKTYSIAQVEGLTGVKAGTLRIWEKRYNFLVPERTKTKIRYYSDPQLKLLLNVSILIDSGLKISKISKLSENEIYQRSQEVQLTGEVESAEIKKLTIAMMDFDESAFVDLLQTYSIRSGLTNMVTQLVYPFLHKIGILWGVNKLMPAQEHFISNLIRSRLIVGIEQVKPLKRLDKKAILFLPPGEYHEIGLLLSHFIFKNAGWKVYYLGANVPLENIFELESSIKPDALFTLMIAQKKKSQSQTIQKLTNNTTTQILISGNSDLLENASSPKLKKISSPNQLINELNEKIFV